MRPTRQQGGLPLVRQAREAGRVRGVAARRGRPRRAAPLPQESPAAERSLLEPAPRLVPDFRIVIAALAMLQREFAVAPAE